MTRLRAHEGGVELPAGGRTLRVHLVASGRAPTPIDALVFEEDTHRVLGAPAVLPREPEHPVRVMTALLDHAPVRPGQALVVQSSTRPYRIAAIVHDVDRTPTWQPDWVRAALTESLRACERLQVRTLALPVLAARHGHMDPVAFASMLPLALRAVQPAVLHTVWLLLPPLGAARRFAVARALGD